MKIFITSIGSFGFGPSLVKLLRKTVPDIEIYGMDISMNSAAIYMVDHSVIGPKYGPKAIQFIVDKCREEKIDLVLPLSADNEMLPLLKLEEDTKVFSKMGTKIIGQGVSIDTYENCVYKDRTYAFLKDKAITYPKYFTPKNIYEFENAVRDLGYPKKKVLIKPITGAGNRGLRILDSTFDIFDSVVNQKPDSSVTDLDIYLDILKRGKEFPDILIMEYLPGREFTVYCLCEHGKPLYIIPLERKVTTAGMSLIAQVDMNPTVIEYCKQIIKEMNLHGVVDLQMKFNEEGKPSLYEINPRYSASIIVSYAAGVNLALFGILQTLGKEIPRVDVKDGLKMIRYADEIFIDEKEVFRIDRKKPTIR